MLCVLDIGNTAVKVGLRTGGGHQTEIHSFRSESASIPEIISLITGNKAPSAGLCSVNPAITAELTASLADAGIETVQFNYSNIPLEIRYEPPSAAGSDRLVAAYAAYADCGGAAVVVDMGTAVTFEAVNGQGAYLGGSILPGTGLWARSLNEHTALLPEVTLPEPELTAIGTGTEQALRKGLFWGMLSVITGVAQKTAEECGEKCVFYLTGGGAPLFREYVPESWRFTPDLLIDGLFLLHGPEDE